MQRNLFLILGIATVLTIYNLVTRSPSPPPASEQLRQLQDIIRRRHYTILSLGGPTTLGANLKHKTHSYPYILGSPSKKVSNAALDVATGGSNYPSLCLECMVENKEFDVILLEFSLTGTEGIELLLKRLRYRFPRAIIIYIHLYSLQTDVADMEDVHGWSAPNHDHIDMEHLDSYKWGYGESMSNAVYHEIKRIVDNYGVIMYGFPRSTNVKDVLELFSPDWRYLSQIGHNIVAEGVLSILKDIPADPEKRPIHKHDEPFGSRDECVSWFVSGKVPFKYQKPIKLSSFSASGSGNKEYALEIAGTKPGTMSIVNSLPMPAPLYMFYMAQSEAYPIVEVVAQEKVKIVDPMINADRHVMKSEQVGWVTPGVNEITIKPLTESVLPFRVTGFAFCEACIHLEQHDEEEFWQGDLN
eukprot:CAMPEP_0172490362 /NCGR_PEP_ID=MMETSP1066-20121228/20739_1 /TAXON_ID=671091 /ORGANISM="Coscinodiscus wailesii, Strain CCMP2513" /LENGTH=413 /DNA_ID=CAMNT_0013258771 /DNA_START=29 /DNA_END=1270 /DNA_ORIENTATION=-